MVIAIDVDDTLADLMPVWLSRYNKDYGDGLSAADIMGWSLVPFVKQECGYRIYDYLEDPTLYDEVRPIENATWAVNRLRIMGHRIYFVTASTLGHSGRKLRWLQTWGFLGSHRTTDKSYVECSDKSIIRCDAIIDDKPENVSGHPTARGILFSRPHNMFFDWTARAEGWEDVLGYF